MIAVSGKCAAREIHGRTVCTAKTMEEMMERCQFFEPHGMTCKHLAAGSYRACRSAAVREWLCEGKK
jgi:hypothetical protein